MVGDELGLFVGDGVGDLDGYSLANIDVDGGAVSSVISKAEQPSPVHIHSGA